VFARFAFLDSLVAASQWTLPAEGQWYFALPWLLVWALVAIAAAAIVAWLTTRYIPNDHVGIVEKLWSPLGSLDEGQLIALGGEAGFQAEILRGGLHFGLCYHGRAGADLSSKQFRHRGVQAKAVRNRIR
jgi:hypothetical protein